MAERKFLAKQEAKKLEAEHEASKLEREQEERKFLAEQKFKRLDLESRERVRLRELEIRLTQGMGIREDKSLHDRAMPEMSTERLSEMCQCQYMINRRTSTALTL